MGENYVYTNFLKSRTCYDIMPKSSKIVVFDIKLKVSKIICKVNNVTLLQNFNILKRIIKQLLSFQGLIMVKTMNNLSRVPFSSIDVTHVKFDF